MGSLYICGTPIGNLEDSTFRLKSVLSKVDLILCEDTRRAKKLINFLEIETPYESFFVGNEHKKNAEIINKIKEGIDIALISDAGMPTISDPGSLLVQIAGNEGIDVIVIPGPSSVVAALSLSGFIFTEFTFFGFLKKKGSERIEQINQIVRAKRPSIFFTSPLRLKKDLQTILDQGGVQEIAICRELTKIHETVYRGNATSLLNDLEDKDLKGEVTVIVDSAIEEIISDEKLIEAASILIKEGSDKRRVAKALSKVSQFSVNEIYSMIQNF